MYIFPRNIATQQLAGVYQAADFCLPTNSLAAAAAAPAATADMVQAVSTKTLKGGYVDSRWTTPPYRNTGMGGTFNDAINWAKSNPLYVALGIGAAFLLTMGRGRRR